MDPFNSANLVFTRVARAMVACSLTLGVVSCAGDGTDGGPPIPAVPDASRDPVSCETGEVDGNLNFYGRANRIDPVLIDAFEAEHGVQVLMDTYAPDESVVSKLQSGAAYDLATASHSVLGELIELDLIRPVRKSVLPNFDALHPVLQDTPYDPRAVYSIVYQWGTVGFGAGADLETGDVAAATWGALFDPELIARYPAPVSLKDDSRQTLGAALKYLGYSLNSTNDTELTEAAGVVTTALEAGAHIAADSDPAQAIESGGLTAAHGSSTEFRTIVAGEEPPAAFLIPQEGAALWFDSLVVPERAERICTAHTFIDFLIDGENVAATTNWNIYASANQAAERLMVPVPETGDESPEEEDTEGTDVASSPFDELNDGLEMLTDVGEAQSEYDALFAVAKS